MTQEGRDVIVSDVSSDDQLVIIEDVSLGSLTVNEPFIGDPFDDFEAATTFTTSLSSSQVTIEIS